MSEKKELNNEELKNVAGGGRDGRDGATIENPTTTNQGNFDAIYGSNNTEQKED